MFGVTSLLAACASAQPPTSAEEGWQLVQQNCVGCHQANRTGSSPYRTAPPLRLFAGLTPYDIQNLAWDITAGNHYSMPRITMTERDAAAIRAYILTLQPDYQGPKLPPIAPCLADSFC